jgi:hypothetical protein
VILELRRLREGSSNISMRIGVAPAVHSLYVLEIQSAPYVLGVVALLAESDETCEYPNHPTLSLLDTPDFVAVGMLRASLWSEGFAPADLTALSCSSGGSESNPIPFRFASNAAQV